MALGVTGSARAGSQERVRTIYADVSEIVVERGNTGIQRVVRRVVAEAPKAAGDAGFRFVPVVATASGICRLSAAGIDALASPAPIATSSTVADRTSAGRIATLAKAILLRLPGVYEALRTRRLDRAFAGLIDPKRIAVGKDDIYLILDSFWMRSSAPREAERLRRRGHHAVALIYDVLSLTHPAYFIGELPALFAKQFRRMALAGVRFVSISQEAATQVERALPPGSVTPVLHFRLGHDFKSESTPSRSSGVTLSPPIFLTVGTLESRKNHRVVLAAFEQLWAEGFKAVLMIVGKPGWGVDPLLTRLASHPERGRRLIVEHAASDEMLRHAYGSATATIVASFAEGFGLPLVESLSAGIPVIASDIPVFRETVGDTAVLFDPTQPSDLARAVRRMMDELPDYRARTARFSWPDWQTATAQLIAQVVRQTVAS